MEKLKKNPTSIRFDKEKMDFIKKQENLPTVQKVLNFLLDKYWWEHKFGVNPILERNNQFINAARGRDAEGVNKDELVNISKKVANKLMSPFKVRNFNTDGSIEGIYTEKAVKKVENIKCAETSYSNIDLERQIAEIRAEKIPAHRNTSIGKKSWEIEQQNLINNLKQKLK